MNQLENCQARYHSNTWMGRTRTDGPHEFEPSKFDCNLNKPSIALVGKCERSYAINFLTDKFWT